MSYVDLKMLYSPWELLSLHITTTPMPEAYIWKRNVFLSWLQPSFLFIADLTQVTGINVPLSLPKDLHVQQVHCEWNLLVIYMPFLSLAFLTFMNHLPALQNLIIKDSITCSGSPQHGQHLCDSWISPYQFFAPSIPLLTTIEKTNKYHLWTAQELLHL